MKSQKSPSKKFAAVTIVVSHTDLNVSPVVTVRLSVAKPLDVLLRDYPRRWSKL